MSVFKVFMRSDDEALGMKWVVKISSIDNCPKDKKTKVRKAKDAVFPIFSSDATPDLPAPPPPVPQAFLLFLDLVCHNSCSSRLSFFWPSNCLPESPAATNFSFLLAFSFSHRDTNVNSTEPICQSESGHSFGVSN